MNQPNNEQTATREEAFCATCQQPLHGPYCSQCGEKKLDKHDKKIAHVFEELIHSFTHADSKFLRSLKFLFTKPGFLTSEYLAGRRKPYSSPLSLFLIANLLYLLCGPVDTFSSRFTTIVKGQPYSEALTPQVQAKMQKKHWTYEQLEDRYNERSSHDAKLLLILYIFLLSIPVALLFISRKRDYYDHFIFAMEYGNFIMYGIMLLLPWLVTLVAVGIALARHHGGAVTVNVTSPWVYCAVLLLICTYLTIAAHRAFKQYWWLAVTKAAALTFFTIVAMFLYRFIAFEVSMFLL